jgi:hypothetical protein
MSKQYIRHFGIAISIVLGAVIAINLLVDPYGIFQLTPPGTVNERKPALATRARLAKPYQVTRAAPRTILIGNSRTEAGLDPQADSWPKSMRPVFNLSVGGAGVPLQYRFLQHAVATKAPATVVLGLDFLDFLFDESKECSQDFLSGAPKPYERSLRVDRTGRELPFFWPQKLLDFRDVLLSLDGIRDSIQTLLQQSPIFATRTLSGFNPNDDVAESIRIEGYAGVFQHADATLRKSLTKHGRTPVLLHPDCSKTFAALDAILSLQNANQFDLYMYIHPYHARLFSLIHELGLWPSYEKWKTLLVARVDKQGQQASGHVFLWDFGLHSSLTTEQVSSQMRSPTDLTFFWESGHYKAAAGDIVVKTMFDLRKSTEEGRLLSTETMQFHLCDLRRRRDVFNVSMRPSEVSARSLSDSCPSNRVE